MTDYEIDLTKDWAAQFNRYGLKIEKANTTGAVTRTVENGIPMYTMSGARDACTVELGVHDRIYFLAQHKKDFAHLLANPQGGGSWEFKVVGSGGPAAGDVLYLGYQERRGNENLRNVAAAANSLVGGMADQSAKRAIIVSASLDRKSADAQISASGKESSLGVGLNADPRQRFNPNRAFASGTISNTALSHVVKSWHEKRGQARDLLGPAQRVFATVQQAAGIFKAIRG
ncbi:hypothetical protein [Methylobrevis albus]|uniref:Uncharacterized protein n=1 Tax=Methylobrevis albus TaxID=2793297 RepID=A0A931I4Y7_9HYPH|nr:hypothetical protein [Methylobrevis albus]MBH0239356.1 hypothetical protein [Methylobrevis albus]